MNTLKTMFLMVTLTLLLLFSGGLLGGKSGLTIALLMAFGLNFITYWFSDRIVLRMYGARPAGETEAPEFYSMVNRLAQQAGLPLPKMYIIVKDQLNAFATGRNPQHGAVTTGLMRLLSREELEGLIGHELAHIKHRDCRRSQDCRRSRALVQGFKKDGKGSRTNSHECQPGNGSDVYCQSPFRGRFIETFQHPHLSGQKI